MAFEAYGSVLLRYLLSEALYHEWSEGRVDELIEHDKQMGKNDKEEDREKYDASYFSAYRTGFCFLDGVTIC